MDKETRQQMIYESFDALKDSWDNKEDAIMRLICKMFAINPKTACDMWIYILKKNKSLLTDLDCSYKASGLVDSIIEAIVHGINCGLYFDNFDNEKEISLANEVFSNKELYTLIYGVNCSIGEGSSKLLSHLMVTNDSAKLFEILNMIDKHKIDETIGKILTSAIEHCNGDERIPPVQIGLLENFVAKIKDKKDRAEAFTALLSIDEED